MQRYQELKVSKRLGRNQFLFLRDCYGKKLSEIALLCFSFSLMTWSSPPLSEQKSWLFPHTFSERPENSQLHGQNGQVPFPRVGSSWHLSLDATSPQEGTVCLVLVRLGCVSAQHSQQQQSLTSVLCQVLPAAPHNHGRSVWWGPTELEYSFCPNRRSREQSKIPLGYRKLQGIILPELLDSTSLRAQ